MMRMIAAAMVGLMLIGTAEAQSGRGQPVDLRPRWPEGAEWRFRMETSSCGGLKAAQNGPEARRQQVCVFQDSTLVLKVIESKPEGDSTVEMVIESSKATVRTPEEGERVYDSRKRARKGEEPGIGAGMLDLVGVKLTLVVTPDGHIREIRGGEGVASSELTAGFTDPDKASKLFGPILALKQGGGLVKVGESWETEDLVTTGVLGRIRVINKHTLRSASRGLAKVATRGRIESESESAGVRIREGEFTGSYEWDTGEGMLRRMDSKTSFEVEVDTGLDTASMTSEITQRITRMDR